MPAETLLKIYRAMHLTRALDERGMNLQRQGRIHFYLASTGQEAWGMEWQTLDSVAKVQAFYAKQLNQGDWTVNFNNNSGASFAATYSRRSDSHAGGTLAGNSASGVTKILLTLVEPR